MKKRRLLDLTIAALSFAIAALLYFYMDYGRGRRILAAVLLGVGILFFFLALLPQKKARAVQSAAVPLKPSGAPMELVLIGDEGAELAVWELYGKSGLVIGRDVGENHVDINLGNSTYASMVDTEHAVLNYASGSWYAEDLGSKNGISVQKAVDSRRYKLAADKPCQLAKGDILFVGLARLLLR